MASFTKIAHRGASGCFPENTRLAFERALDARADMIEMDCQLTQDGHVVIFHDERLNRTAGVRGALRDQTLEQIKKLDVGRWFKKAFRGQRILTLEEVLEFIGGRSDLCLDIKQYPESPAGIEIKLLFTLSHFDYLDRTILSSFNYRCLSRVRYLAPEARIGILYGAGIAEEPLAAAERLEAASVHVQRELATRQFLSRAWDHGFDVYVWTVNEVRDMEFYMSLGVQGIISDFPERFSKLSCKGL